MAMNVNEGVNTLRPIYDFALPSLENDLGSRSLIYKAIPPGSYVLDVGCDTGRFGEALRTQKNCDVDGVEPYLTAAEVAKTRLNNVFVRSIKNEQSFDGLVNYNAILFLCVLEHLQDPWAVLKGALKTLKPGGTVYVVVPNIAHISVVRRLLLGQFDYSQFGTMDRTHLRWFTRKSLRESLENAGFVNINIDIIPTVPYLNQNFFISRFLTKQIGTILPDLFGSSIIGFGSKPITNE
ncbi:class I SAM-dependent methyltransferase [Tolypothrix campylonemoides VB511288]|nr:class I SAM-dependent methyltransferase [Tolypothrix campylonemoides VB511288]